MFVKAIILGNAKIRNCSDKESLIIAKQILGLLVKFMKGMYNESLMLFKSISQIDCKILKQFKSVKLLDDTLPNSMENMYKGHGQWLREQY